jgi:ankyrin repeat protein
MEKDSNGQDSLMHAVKLNNFKLLEMFVTNCKKQINYSATDKFGKTLIHYAVAPNEDGSFENEEILGFLIEKGFVPNAIDKFGMSPIDYACQQENGVNLKIFKRFNIAPQEAHVSRRKNSFTSTSWPVANYNYEQDSEVLYESKSVNILQ